MSEVIEEPDASSKQQIVQSNSCVSHGLDIDSAIHMSCFGQVTDHE
jgi:hypothetical protein